MPIRRTFVQQGLKGKPHPGPLANLVRAHDGRALKLWLLLMAGASSNPWDVTLSARVWARAAGVDEPAGISKVWRRLHDLRLIKRARSGRKAAITPLKEDGSGEDYTHPYVERERYFQLPYAFWTAEQRWYRTLDLAETAVLLIALTLGDSFLLPSDKAKSWYGISADTVERGLRGLQGYGLLSTRKGYKEAPLSPLGYTLERRYTLQPPFGPQNKSAITVETKDFADLIRELAVADGGGEAPASVAPREEVNAG